ncbi:MAG: DsbA family protein [Patescibacteria group bacterium]|nr:DsbA family protein [Patescibacteria group bacterium]
MEDKKGFFDGNPKMLFVFGLVTGVALTSILGGSINWPTLNSNNDEVVRTFDDPNTDGTGDTGGDVAVLDPVTNKDHILGDIKKAKVVLVEYSDFECPYCERHTPTLQQVMEDYGNDVALVFRHFPLTSIHAEAAPAAEASECAAEQGKFWEFHDEMFARQSELGDDLYYEVAGDLKLDQDQFDKCYTERIYAQDVADDLQSGVKAGVQGTPATFINGMLVSGAVPYETMVDAIEAVLAE